MSGPVWVARADTIGAEEGGGGGAGVGGFDAIDGGGLDDKGERAGGVVHGVNEHAGDLTGDDVVGDAVGYLGIDDVG